MRIDSMLEATEYTWRSS